MIKFLSILWTIFTLIAPYKMKAKMSVKPMAHLSDSFIKYLATNFYKNLHKRGKVKLKSLIKKRLKNNKSFDLVLAHYVLLTKDDPHLRIFLVRESLRVSRIKEVFVFVSGLNADQRITLLERLWYLIEHKYMPWHSEAWNLFIERSEEFSDFHKKRQQLQDRINSLNNSTVVDFNNSDFF